MASDLEILFGADASAVMSAVDDVKAKLGEIGGAAKDAGEEAKGGFKGFFDSLKEGLEGIEGVKKSIEGFAALVAGAFAVREIKEFVESMGELGEQTERTAKILGLSTEEVGRLNYA
jgi:hypothetical protein